MTNKVSIKMERYGEAGWAWTVSGEDMIGEKFTHSYRTNRQGDGLWSVGSYTGQWSDNYQDNQISGTSQFQLPTGRKAAYSKLYREFTRDGR